MTWLGWFAAAWLAGGAMTALAVALICRSDGKHSMAPRLHGRQNILNWLKVFALWPGVVMMGTVFAILMLAQRRQ